jgi:hypothetical protein
MATICQDENGNVKTTNRNVIELNNYRIQEAEPQSEFLKSFIRDRDMVKLYSLKLSERKNMLPSAPLEKLLEWQSEMNEINKIIKSWDDNYSFYPNLAKQFWPSKIENEEFGKAVDERLSGEKTKLSNLIKHYNGNEKEILQLNDICRLINYEEGLDLVKSVKVKYDERQKVKEAPIHKIKPDVRIDDLLSDCTPTFSDLLIYYKSKGIVDEEKLCILQTLCAINSLHFGIEGHTGSGKTFLANALIDLLPDNYVYEIQLASNTAPFVDSENINGKKFIYIPELQKPLEKKNFAIIEAIKNITEGKDTVRQVTKKMDEAVRYVIKAGATVFYTLALENNFKLDSETSRRFIKFYTDSSPEHIERVKKSKAAARLNSNNGHAELSLKLSTYINSCVDCSDLLSVDVFSVPMQEYFPTTLNAVSLMNHYYKLLDASAKFNLARRVREENKIFLNLEDHYNIYSLYYTEFCSQLADPLFEKKSIDWQNVWEAGSSKLRESYPQVYEKWAGSQVHDNKITAKNPLTNESVVLIDSLEARI